MQEDAGARETPEAVGDVLAAFREIVDTAVTPTWLLSPDSSMLHANGPLHDWCGASARELQGVGWLTRLHPEDAAHSSAYWQRLFADGQSTEIYFRLRRMDGSYAGLCANCIPLRDGSGAWLVTTRLESPASGTAAVLTRLDPNANGHALRALFFEHMLEPAFIWELSEKRPIIDWNRGAEQTFGFESQEAIGRDARELLQTRACTRWSEIEASLKREGSWQGELLQRHRLGDTLAIETRLQLVLCAGRPPLVLESGIDNSALRQGERAVIEGQARLRLALSSARIGIWEWRLGSDRLVWSSEAKTVLGSPPEEFAPTLPALIARVHPDDRASVRERLEDAVAHVRDVELEFRCPRHDHVRWLRCRGIVERDEGGRATRVVGTISDVTPERLQEASLRESEQRARARADELSALMDALPAAVWIAHDRHAKQVTGSRVGHEILRMPWGANLSKTAEDTAPVQHFTVLKDGLELQPDELPLQVAALTGKEIRDFEEEIRFGDGSSIYLYGSAVPLLDEKREPRGAIAAFIDVTRIKHAESEQRAAARRKDEFLAILSHELRNPLAPILTAVHLMKLRGDVPAPNERDVIERQAKHLVRLVNDLLDISRVASGKIVLNKERIELSRVVDRAVETISPLLELKEHQLHVAVAPNGLVIDADEVRLSQVISNLLSNAARYTPKGGEIWLTAASAGHHVELSVRDNGAGIAPELLPQIFEMFVQGQRGRDRAEGGLGLGLALVRSLTTLHDGSVEAFSAGPGRGSEFKVRLPLAETQATKGPPSAARNTIFPRVQGKRVLVVDDNPDALELLAQVLTSVGHEVRAVLDPPQALALLREFQPEVAVLDIGLPVMDGYELALEIQRRMGAATPRLIALTGYGQEHDVQRSRESGFQVHMVKPVDVSQLLDHITREGTSLSLRPPAH